MTDWFAVWPWQLFDVRPRRHDDTGDIRDPQGALLAYFDRSGAVYDASGKLLVRTLIQSPSGRGRTDFAMPIWDAGGVLLGRAHVGKYFFGPRAKRLAVDVLDESSGFLTGLEPRDKMGLQLAATSAVGDLAGIAVEEAKTGFLQRTRVYCVSMYQMPSASLLPLVLAVVSRFDALLTSVMAASSSSDLH